MHEVDSGQESAEIGADEQGVEGDAHEHDVHHDAAADRGIQSTRLVPPREADGGRR